MLPLNMSNVDTDQIMPKQFLKRVERSGYGEYLFYDVRHDEDGNPTEHSLNDPDFKDASILLSGMNFGCGSSREHAPQSIYRAGFRAVIAGNFAEIFFGNSINLGMPCLSMNEPDRKKLTDLVTGNPEAELKLDLIECKLRSENLVLPFTLNEGARDSLIRGMWDPLEELIEANSEIERVSKTLNYT